MQMKNTWKQKLTKITIFLLLHCKINIEIKIFNGKCFEEKYKKKSLSEVGCGERVVSVLKRMHDRKSATKSEMQQTINK